MQTMAARPASRQHYLARDIEAEAVHDVTFCLAFHMPQMRKGEPSTLFSFYLSPTN